MAALSNARRVSLRISSASCATLSCRSLTAKASWCLRQTHAERKSISEMDSWDWGLAIVLQFQNVACSEASSCFARAHVPLHFGELLLRQLTILRYPRLRTVTAPSPTASQPA